MSVTALNREWSQLDLAAHATVARWALAHRALAGCRSLDDVLEAIRRDPDAALGALLAEDRQGGAYAGRVVLQAMLGKVVAMASRDAGATAEEYAAQLWLVIRAYPLERRPERIAANLALDTLKAVKAERDPRTVAVEAVDDAPAVEPADHDDLRARRVLRAAEELGLIDADTHAVLASVYAEGLSGIAAAERHRTSAQAIRKRCSVSVRRLAAHRLELLEVA
ncbi:RNA polymerase sigma factor [Mariniluteicoccus flavus]